ncbi:MAG: hypothetical protein GX065_03625 [Firmicutes bacterium]|jgi:hypothetical protein|nr:hypothetical protein [Bacillota bacterium]
MNLNLEQKKLITAILGGAMLVCGVAGSGTANGPESIGGAGTDLPAV